MAEYKTVEQVKMMCESEEERKILDNMSPLTSRICYYLAMGLPKYKVFELIYDRKVDVSQARKIINKQLREDAGGRLYTLYCQRASLKETIDIYGEVELALHGIATGKTTREEVHKLRDGTSERLVRAEVTPDFGDRVTAGKTLLEQRLKMEQLTLNSGSGTGQVQINFGGFLDEDDDAEE